MNLFFAFAPWLDGLDEDAMGEVRQMFVGDQADRIIKPYRRARPKDSLRDLVLAIATNHAMRMPSLVTADRKVAQHAAPVFVYMFAWETPVLEGKLKSPHALIPFVFDTVETSGLTGDLPTRFALADKMSGSRAFARTGNPDHGDLPSWTPYSTEQRPTMIFDNQCRVENDPYRAERLAWEAR